MLNARTLFRIALSTVAAIALPGCTHSSQVRLDSLGSPVSYTPDLPTAVYGSSDPTSAEILLTDLSPAQLDPGADLSNITGCIVQIRMFLDPSPGNTPIAKTAVNSSIRQIVLAGGTVGVYSGGGFVLPSDRPGDARFHATIRDATLRLTGVRGSFIDRLGPSNLNATLAPARNESMTRRISARVDEIMRTTHTSSAKDQPGS